MVFAQHHWPVWGNARVLDYLAKQRDLYKYLHDQTLRLMNHGYKAAEIAERLALPQEPRDEWHVRGYYGTLQPQRQGRLPALPRLVRRQPGQPQPAAAGRARRKKYVELHGRRRRGDRPGARGLRQGRVPLGGRGHEPRRVRRPGEHRGPRSSAPTRWSSSATRRSRPPGATPICWAPSSCAAACRLPAARRAVSPDIVRAMSLDLFFDYLGVRLNGEKAEGKTHRHQLGVLRHSAERYALTLRELRPDLSGRPARARAPTRR